MQASDAAAAPRWRRTGGRQRRPLVAGAREADAEAWQQADLQGKSKGFVRLALGLYLCFLPKHASRPNKQYLKSTSRSDGATQFLSGPLYTLAYCLCPKIEQSSLVLTRTPHHLLLQWWHQQRSSLCSAALAGD